MMIVDRLADVRIDEFLHPIGRSYLDAYAGGDSDGGEG